MFDETEEVRPQNAPLFTELKEGVEIKDIDFGYLPGTLEEKMGPLVASYMDNLEEILGNADTPIKETREIIEDN